ncbi:MAG: acyl-CoA dehydrogenase family protein [Anaerolineae bacterium]|nr:acyl-CoA dehydrogenase family protein [Anaerolineae bacterium]
MSMLKREIFEKDHQMFRDSFRKFVEREIVPHHEEWEKQKLVPREVWLKAGENGFLGFNVPEEYGGMGVLDFRYNAIITEELVRVGASGPGFSLHNDICIPYILHYGTEEQKQRFLPKMVTGEYITAIAMTEPNTGSDLAGVRTTAIRENGCFTVNGQKTFITNGINSDIVITVVKTKPEEKHAGISLLLIERGMEGFERGRNLDKMGMKAQDTAELYFSNVQVPENNLLGDEGAGFFYLMTELPQERMSIAIGAVAGAKAALEMTLQYVQERQAFGRPIGTFQNSRFKLAEMKTEIQIAEVFVDKCITELNKGELSTEVASMAKWWTTELLKNVVDTCVQLHGGYGYMMEYPIAKAYLDARVQSIYGGTTEIMKEIIGRAMGL